MNTFSHLSAQAAELMQLDKDVRMQQLIGEVFIQHDRLNPILDHVEYLRYQPTRSRAGGLAVTGMPGSGKTFLAKMIAQRYGRTRASQTQSATRPVVMLNMTGAREAKTIYNRLLEALDCPRYLDYRGSDRERMALKMCRQAEVRLIIVDELQDVLECTVRQRAIALETVKTLMNELCVPILALGIDKVREALECDPHLNARFVYRQLPKWEDDVYLVRFLEALEHSLPLARPSNLPSLAIRRAILKASQGVMDQMVRYLCWSAVYAVEDGTEHITPALIEKAAVQPPKAAIVLERKRAEAAALAKAA